MKKQETLCRICEAPINGDQPIADLCEYCQRYETTRECCHCHLEVDPGYTTTDKDGNIWCDQCYGRHAVCHTCGEEHGHGKCRCNAYERPCYHTHTRPVDYQEDGRTKYGAVCLNCGKFLPESTETIEIR